MTRPIVVLDFDSTIAESMESLFEHQEYWNDGPEKYEYDDSHWYSLDAVGDATTQQQMWAYFHSDLGISHVKPKAGAIETINRLIDHGVRIVVATDRSVSSYTALWAWFRRNGVTRMAEDFGIAITGGERSKQQFVQTFLADEHMWNVVAVVDDAPHHMERYSDVYGEFGVYSFRYPYNAMQIEKGLAIEITSWAEFGDIVLNELA